MWWRVPKGYGKAAAAAASLRLFLFNNIYIFLLWNAFFPYQQTNHLYSIHVRRPRELSPRLFGVYIYIYNIHIIYAANTPRHADIEHYDLHSNWNEISTKVDRRRRIEIYSCRWFLTLFGYGLIIWFGHSIPRKKHQAAHI